MNTRLGAHVPLAKRRGAGSVSLRLPVTATTGPRHLAALAHGVLERRFQPHADADVVARARWLAVSVSRRTPTPNSANHSKRITESEQQPVIYPGWGI
jgi:hypothetical protein